MLQPGIKSVPLSEKNDTFMQGYFVSQRQKTQLYFLASAEITEKWFLSKTDLNRGQKVQRFRDISFISCLRRNTCKFCCFINLPSFHVFFFLIFPLPHIPAALEGRIGSAAHIRFDVHVNPLRPMLARVDTGTTNSLTKSNEGRASIRSRVDRCTLSIPL